MAREGLFDDSGYDFFDGDLPCEWDKPCSKWVQVNRDGDMDEIRCVMYDNCEMRKELEDEQT